MLFIINFYGFLFWFYTNFALFSMFIVLITLIVNIKIIIIILYIFIYSKSKKLIVRKIGQFLERIKLYASFNFNESV